VVRIAAARAQNSRVRAFEPFTRWITRPDARGGVEAPHVFRESSASGRRPTALQRARHDETPVIAGVS